MSLSPLRMHNAVKRVSSKKSKAKEKGNRTSCSGDAGDDGAVLQTLALGLGGEGAVDLLDFARRVRLAATLDQDVPLFALVSCGVERRT